MQVRVERAQRRVPRPEPARELGVLAPQHRQPALADLLLGQPRVGRDGQRGERLEHQRLALGIGAQRGNLGGDRVRVLAELAPEAAQVVGDLALVVGERGLVDRLCGGHRGRELAHELRRAGAQTLELGLQLGERALQRARVQLARAHRLRQLAEQRADARQPGGVEAPDGVNIPARSSKNCSTRSPSAVTS